MSDMIKLLHPYQCGPAITRLQEALEMIGSYHGRHDSIYGPITEKAVKAFQRTHNLVVDGIVGPKTWAAINKNMDAIMSPGKPRVEISDPCLFDFRRGHTKPALYSNGRDLDRVTGVTLHQTGCRMGDRPESWKRLNAHIGITRRGECVLVNDLTDFIWHAQGLSASTVGIEIEGNYSGIEGNPKTLWKKGGPECHLTQIMIDAFGLAMDWIVRELGKANLKLETIHAHRQSSDKRVGDPGSEIWREMALPWMERLGINDGGEYFKVGSGKYIPKEWDPKSLWRYWG